MSENYIQFNAEFESKNKAESIFKSLIDVQEYLENPDDKQLPMINSKNSIKEMGIEKGWIIEKLNLDENIIAGEIITAPSSGDYDGFAKYLNSKDAIKLTISLYLGWTGDKTISEYENGKHIRTINEEDLYDSRLHEALRNGQFDEFKKLIDNGADVNAVWYDGYTPLHEAASTGPLEAIKILIDKGAKINQKNIENVIPLHNAVRAGDHSIVETLIKCGSEINAADSTAYGGTPLHRAAYEGFDDIAKLLLENGANPNFITEDGSPLTLSCQNYTLKQKHKKTIEVLIQYGANIDIPGPNGNTALLKSLDASEGSGIEIAEMLINNGADINIIGQYEWSALHFAVYEGHLKIVKLLIEKGANVNLQDEEDETPLDIALEKNHKEIINYIKQHGAKTKNELKT